MDLFRKVKGVQETNVMCRYMPEHNTLSNLWSLLVNDREKMFPFPNENEPHKKRPNQLNTVIREKFKLPPGGT